MLIYKFNNRINNDAFLAVTKLCVAAKLNLLMYACNQGIWLWNMPYLGRALLNRKLSMRFINIKNQYWFAQKYHKYKRIWRLTLERGLDQKCFMHFDEIQSKKSTNALTTSLFMHFSDNSDFVTFSQFSIAYTSTTTTTPKKCRCHKLALTFTFHVRYCEIIIFTSERFYSHSESWLMLQHNCTLYGFLKFCQS